MRATSNPSFNQVDNQENNELVDDEANQAALTDAGTDAENLAEVVPPQLIERNLTVENSTTFNIFFGIFAFLISVTAFLQLRVYQTQYIAVPMSILTAATIYIHRRDFHRITNFIIQRFRSIIMHMRQTIVNFINTDDVVNADNNPVRARAVRRLQRVGVRILVVLLG